MLLEVKQKGETACLGVQKYVVQYIIRINSLLWTKLVCLLSPSELSKCGTNPLNTRQTHLRRSWDHWIKHISCKSPNISCFLTIPPTATTEHTKPPMAALPWRPSQVQNLMHYHENRPDGPQPSLLLLPFASMWSWYGNIETMASLCVASDLMLGSKWRCGGAVVVANGSISTRRVWHGC